VLVTAPDRQLLGVEVLEQRLGELAGGSELVAQRSQRDRATVALRQGDQACAGLLEWVRMEVQALRDADRTARFAEGGEVVCVQLAVQWRLEAGRSQAVLER
jgi:hypothetical protein